MQAEDAAKRYRQGIGNRRGNPAAPDRKAVTVPDVPYAKVNAVSRACKDIGGDFFDLVYTEQGLSLIVADVSGKGVSAAVVASILPRNVVFAVGAGFELARHDRGRQSILM